MKNQKINYKIKIYCLLFFLSITFGVIGQEVIREEGFNYSGHTYSEDSLKNKYLFSSGSKKHRLEEIMMPVEIYSAVSLPKKTETIKSGEEWNIHRVHNGKLFSWMSDRSLALDANEKPHIAYGQTHLYYAWYDEEWHIETVDDSWDVGWYVSLALDSDGYPHISYYDRDPNGDLKYAYKDANGWHIATVDDDGTVGWFTSIALDANNHPHISYHDGTNGDLKYTYWDGSEWIIQTIDTEGVLGYWSTSLAIGPNNFPHISYSDSTKGNLKYAHWDGNEWQIVTVDNDDNVGGYSSLALDENGYAHISYLDYANANLKYAFWNGSEWQLATVDEGEIWGVGWYNSIVLAESGNPHISYFDNTTGNLKYACLSGSEWNIQSVSIPCEYPWGCNCNIGGFFTSIALDINGNPHISSVGRLEQFGAYPDGLLGYSYYDGSKWNFDAVDSLISAGITTSIAVDNDTVSHIGYMRSDGRYSYISPVDNHWERKTFGKVAYGIKEPGSGSFIALDNDGWPHMIYHQKHGVLASRYIYDSFGIGYKYPIAYYPFRRVWFDGSDWQYESLWTSYLPGEGTQREPLSSSLTFDQSGWPHILVSEELTHTEGYYAYKTYQLQHRYFSDSVWHTSTIVESESAVGIDNSIAISNDGIPHISYRGLKYGWFEEDGWNIQTIDSEGGGYFNSLMLDSNDFPHISYYDTLNTALKYAHWNGSEWQIEIVDNNGDVGKYTSLALDANNYPHISYYDETNGNLKYAYWDGSLWQIETVDSYRNVGMYTSLALDANDNLHISYYDASFGDLKYASKRASESILTIVASASENGSITPSGEVEVEYGSEQVFTITPDESFRVAYIRIDDTEINLETDENWDAESGEYIFSNVAEAHTIEVGFNINSYSILAESNDETFGAVSGGGEYNHFEEVTLTATPETGYHFVNWTEDGEEVAISEEYVFTAEQERNLTANFEINTYSILAESNDVTFGAVSGDGEYNHFEEVTLTATSEIGYHFINWTEDEEEVAISEEYVFTAEQERNLVANFEINTYTISVQAAENGSITPTGDVEVEYGNDQIFSITPDEGFRLAYIRIDDTEINQETDENWDAENGQYTFLNVTEAHTIEVGFEDATAIREVADQNELKVYPNPAKNELWIEFNYGGNDRPVIVMKNLQGQTLKQVLVNETGSLRKRMSTQGLASGVYLLTVWGEETFPVKKVVIEN